jgi:hypothetical protein
VNFLNIIRSVEQFVYEIALWIVLIPKTIYKILVHPGTIKEYVESELAKEEKKQFEDQMSPILFWLMLVVIPSYTSIRYLFKDIPTNEITELITKKPENYLFYITSTLLSSILTLALLVQIVAKRKFNKESFKSSFYIQCYLQAPFVFGIIFLLMCMKILHYNFHAMDNNAVENFEYVFFFNKINGWKDIFLIPIIVLFSYFSYIEVRLIIKSGLSTGYAIASYVLCLYAWVFLMCITAGLGYILFIGF